MQTLRHTAAFDRDAKRIFSEAELAEALEMIARDPTCGDVIKGTGGVRKVRVAKEGKGKSGGARVIYFFFDAGAPIWLLAAFGKNEKANLSKAERNAVAEVAAKIKAEHRK